MGEIWEKGWRYAVLWPRELNTGNENWIIERENVIVDSYEKEAYEGDVSGIFE